MAGLLAVDTDNSKNLEKMKQHAIHDEALDWIIAKNGVVHLLWRLKTMSENKNLTTREDDIPKHRRELVEVKQDGNAYTYVYRVVDEKQTKFWDFLKRKDDSPDQD